MICLSADTLPFMQLSMQHKDTINKTMEHYGYENSELSFQDLFMWRKAWPIRACMYGDTLYLLDERNLKPKAFLPVLPMSESLADAMERAIQYSHRYGRSFLMYGINSRYKEWMEREMPGMFEFEYDEDFSDYVYSVEDLATLRGKKMHGKRNHMNKFLKLYGQRFTYESLRAEHAGECMGLFDGWASKKEPDERLALNDERVAILEAFAHWEALGLVGGIIRIDGQARAFTIGEKRKNGMAIVHIEKADTEIPGLYVAICQQFAQNECMDMQWINREEDMGLEGLRKAKRSWNPSHMVDKYIARLAQPKVVR